MSTTIQDSRRVGHDAARILPEPFKTWAGQSSPYPRSASISGLFEEIAAQQANAVALICGAQRVTYGELNALANSLAVRLRDRGVKSETLVAICMERSVEALVAALSVLKAGGAYLPVESDLPASRLESLLRDAQPSLILTRPSPPGRHTFSEIPRLEIRHDFFRMGGSREPTANPRSISGPNNLAYVMYTSGSTGQLRVRTTACFSASRPVVFRRLDIRNLGRAPEWQHPGAARVLTAFAGRYRTSDPRVSRDDRLAHVRSV